MGLVLLQRRARKLRPAGRGGAGGGSGREMHLLNKRRPWRTPREGAGPCRSEAPGGGGRAEPRPRLGDAAALRLALLQLRRPGQHCHMPEIQTPGEKEQPPRGAGGRQNPGWSPARSWRALARHQRGRARAHKAAAILSPSQLGQPLISPILPLLPTAGTERGRVIDGSS